MPLSLSEAPFTEATEVPQNGAATQLTDRFRLRQVKNDVRLKIELQPTYVLARESDAFALRHNPCTTLPRCSRNPFRRCTNTQPFRWNGVSKGMSAQDIRRAAN